MKKIICGLVVTLATVMVNAEVHKRAVVVEKFVSKGCNVSPRELDLLHSLVIDKVSNSRKFEVLERDSDKLQDLIKELSLVDAGVTDGEGPESNKFRAAGFKVLGNVLRYMKTNSPMSDTIECHAIDLQLQIRFERIETSKILAVKTITVNRESRAIKSLLPSDAVEDKLVGEVLDEAAKDVVNALIDVSFPITVLSVNRKVVTANVTMEQAKVGDIFEVYEVGDELIDPQTKESLGFDEEFVGRVILSRPGAKTSKFVLADDKLKIEDIEVGMVLRRLPEEVLAREDVSSRDTTNAKKNKEKRKKLLD